MAETSSNLFKKIRRIHYQSVHLAEDILAGAYRSAFKGKGMEFEEVREYQLGDEMRIIDWNVTARMNHPYVKVFREEREMTVTLIVDISASTCFGSGEHLKKELIAEIAAVLAFSAIKNNDKVALLLFSDQVERYFSPNKGTRHVLRVIRELLTYVPKHTKTNIGTALSFLGKVQHHPSICFLISDFISSSYAHEAALTAARHDLIAIAILDVCESQFPNMGLVTFSDLETKETLLVDTANEPIQMQLQENFKQHLSTQKRLIQNVGADFFTIYTNQSYLAQLRKFFLIRQKRLR